MNFQYQLMFLLYLYRIEEKKKKPTELENVNFCSMTEIVKISLQQHIEKL